MPLSLLQRLKPGYAEPVLFAMRRTVDSGAKALVTPSVLGSVWSVSENLFPVVLVLWIRIYLALPVRMILVARKPGTRAYWLEFDLG